jgi:two-component system phosphate regulon sensor histidine kinase PhoR
VDRERSREAGGTGLGLAIVKHIIEAHGSKVEVYSKVGEGSIFSFILKILYSPSQHQPLGEKDSMYPIRQKSTLNGGS